MNDEFNPNDAIADSSATKPEETSSSNQTQQSITNAANTQGEEISAKASVSDQTEQTATSEQKVKYSGAILSDEYSREIDPKDTSYRVSLPSTNLFNFTNKIAAFNKLKLDPNIYKNWKQVTEESIDQYTVAALYQDRFNDVNSEFYQGVKSAEGNLSTISSLKFKKTDGELKGELALLKVSKMLGLGDVVNIPLPHSGIWITIKPPTERDLIDFYNTAFKEKIVLGRSTHGLTLSNYSAHINNRLYDFILRHVHSVNFGDIEKDQLKNYILIHDFPILAWGFSCAMYPNGYNYQRACVNDIEECSYIYSGNINLTKLLWIDNNSLTEAQRNILSENRPNRLTVESYRKYISEHVRVTSSLVELKNGIKLKLKVPTFNEHIVDGLNWVNKINTAIENIVLEDADSDAEEKTEILNQYVKSSVLRQFNHFVDYIEIEDNVITDRDTINSVLETFSADDDIRHEITESIIKFKVKTTLAIIGIPEYVCPNCGKPQRQENMDERFVNVIPLDVMNLNFLFLTSKISRILEREV